MGDIAVIKDRLALPWFEKDRVDEDTEIGRICDRPTEHLPASAIARINQQGRHTTFYPAVAASSITPFFRAVDRELADVTVDIPRFGHHDITTATQATSIL